MAVSSSDASLEVMDLCQLEHRRRLEQVAAEPSNYPCARFRGRGVVICAGGDQYLTCAYVCIRMLRLLGCTLPVELWHLDAAELPSEWRRILSHYSVEFVNARDLATRIPCRILKGWELKCYALINSQFREMVLIDADNVPLADPRAFFDVPDYQRYGALFWPDRVRIDKSDPIWQICNIEYQDEPQFESGQIVLDKSRCWTALQVAMHLNEWSDFYYRYIYGDKETFHLAWRKLKQAYAMAPPAKDIKNSALYQHDFDGREAFLHRCRYKWTLNGENPPVEGFEYQAQCLAMLNELRVLLAEEYQRQPQFSSRVFRRDRRLVTSRCLHVGTTS